MLYIWNLHNIVHQLYLSFKKEVQTIGIIYLLTYVSYKDTLYSTGNIVNILW